MSKKRNLFDELMQGVAAMRGHRKGKITLRASGAEDSLSRPVIHTERPHKQRLESRSQ